MYNKPLAKQLKELIGQDVRITYKESYNNHIIIVTRVIATKETGIIIELDAGLQAILFPNIKQIESKNLRFISPKEFFSSNKEERDELNIQMDRINTQIIEKIKNLPKYYLSTRKAKFTKNGDFVKTKISQKRFEAEVFDWVRKRETPIELCPLALLNNEFLLTIYQKRFLLLKQNFSIVFDAKYHDINTLVAFIFEQNIQINNKRSSSLRAIAEDFL